MCVVSSDYTGITVVVVVEVVEMGGDNRTPTTLCLYLYYLIYIYYLITHWWKLRS